MKLFVNAGVEVAPYAVIEKEADIESMHIEEVRSSAVLKTAKGAMTAKDKFVIRNAKEVTEAALL